jgi:hypothetical protein
VEKASHLQLRAYREGDAAALAALWGSAHRKYAGYVARTASYWNWNILNRPGVSVNDILVIQEGQEILGYGVLAPNGYVLELAIEPTQSLPKKSEIATMLCKALEDRARANGIPWIYMALPGDDQAVCEALRASDFFEATGDFFNMTIVNPVALIQRLLEHRRKNIPEHWAKTFLLEFTNGYYRFNPFPKVYVQIGNELSVAHKTSDEPTDCRINLSLSTFTELVFNRQTFESAITSGEVAVTPPSEVCNAQQLFNLIRLRAPWFSPLVDRR